MTSSKEPARLSAMVGSGRVGKALWLAALTLVSCEDHGPTQVLIVAGSGGAGSGGAGCTTGDEGCDCYPNDTCNASFVCRNGQCENIGSGGAGGAAGSGN